MEIILENKAIHTGEKKNYKTNGRKKYPLRENQRMWDKTFVFENRTFEKKKMF